MRAFIVLLAGVIVTTANAQWTTSGSNIYNSNAGNVGIGTAAGPATWKFELVGNGQVIRNTSATSYTSLRLYNNQNSSVRSLEFDYSGSSFASPILTGGPSGEAASITTTGAYPLMFGTSNTMRMILNSAGNLGIGTNNPTNRLEVSGSSLNRISAIVTSDVQTGFQAKKTGTNATDWEMYVPSSSTSLRFYNSTFGADVITLNNNGYVGIGTTAPGARLDVNGIARISTGGYLQVGPLNSVSNNFGFVSSAGYVNGTGLKFETTNGAGSIVGVTRMTILSSGNVGIGTSNPDEMLTVNGKVHAKEVRVDLSVPGPDYVFDSGYKLQPLSEIKDYIDANKHLPGVPSAAEMEKNGVSLSEMNMLLLKKIEELTLHMIELRKEVVQLQKIR